jgi:hypothetical protein
MPIALPGGSGPGRVAEFSGRPSQPADDLGMLGVAELGAPDGEAAGSERARSVGIGQPKPIEQLAPAVRRVRRPGGKPISRRQPRRAPRSGRPVAVITARSALADGQVDRPHRAGCERDGDDLAALAGDDKSLAGGGDFQAPPARSRRRTGRRLRAVSGSACQSREGRDVRSADTGEVRRNETRRACVVNSCPAGSRWRSRRGPGGSALLVGGAAGCRRCVSSRSSR